MNNEQMSPVDTPIYLNGCSCNCLWNEAQNPESMESSAMPEKESHRHGECTLKGCPVAMTYTPMQLWEEPFELAKGLHAGTIFPSLRLPFRGGGC